MAKYVACEGNEVILSSKAMQYLFGISDRTLTDWDRNGCPKLGRGQWPLREVLEWKKGDFIQGEDLDKAKLQDRALIADTEYRESKAKREQRTLEILEGKYIAAEHVYREWTMRVAEVKSGLMNWVKSLPPVLDGLDAREIEKRLREEVQVILEKYSRNGAHTPDKPPEEEDEQAAALAAV